MRLRGGLVVVLLSVSVGMWGARVLRAADENQEKKPASCTPAEKNPERHEQFMKDKEQLQKKGPIQLVFEGDSITDGWRGGGHAVFEEDYAKPYNCFNTGIGGDRTEHLLWRIDRGELDGLHPKAVVLMIGTNNLGGTSPNRAGEVKGGNTPEQIAEGVAAIVHAIREQRPQTKILLLAIFPRGEKPHTPIRDKVRDVNRRIARLDDGQHVRYLDIGSKFLDPSGKLHADIMHDYLHLTRRGYQIWADAIQPTLEEMLR